MAETERKSFAQECDRRREEGLKVFGCYKMKDEIKARGGIWDGRLGCWLIPSPETAHDLGLVSKSGRHGDYFAAPKKESVKPPTTERHTCANCNGPAGFGCEAPDANGIAGWVCPRCSRMPAYERSYS